MSKCTIKGLGTHLKVSDIERSRNFYESLGFQPTFAYGDEEFRNSFPAGVTTVPERYRGVTFKIGHFDDPREEQKFGQLAKLEIAEGHIGIKDSGVFAERIESPKISAMVDVESVVPLLDNPDLQITFPVRHYYWGTIEVALRDPDGFVLIFMAKYSPEELERVREYREVEVVEAASVQ